MQRVTLGKTGLNVARIGLGTWGMGGRWWGPVNDQQATLAIEEALDAGINFIDTADVYGFGHSETLLGKTLGARRKDIVLCSKVGLRWNNKGKVRHDLSPGHIFKAIDASLQRLQTDYLDVYFVHWPDPEVPVARTVAALQKCVEAGKVRHLGFSNLSAKEMSAYREFAEFSVCQPPLNLFERYAEVAMLPYCAQHNIGIATYSPLCRGLLAGGLSADDEIKESVRKRDPLFHGATFHRNMSIVAQLKELAAAHDATVAQLAIAWVLTHHGIHLAICGARKPGQLQENVKVAEMQLEHQLLRDIDAILTTTPN